MPRKKTGRSKGGPFKEARTEDHHIVRIFEDGNESSAWKVTVKRRGDVEYKRFRDADYGGKPASFEAARLYRDAVMTIISDADYVLWRRDRGQQRNRSGIVGVGRYVRRESAGGKVRERPYWQAFWHTADGKRRTCSFDIGKYGEKKAKQLACEARRAAMEEVRQELLRRNTIYGA